MSPPTPDAPSSSSTAAAATTISPIRKTEAEAAAPIFAALGDATRLRLLSRLGREGPLSISRLSEGVPVTRQAITKHLRALAGAGLVRDHRLGREHLWELEPRPLDEARLYLDHVSAQWDFALERLRAMVEGEEEPPAPGSTASSNAAGATGS